MTQHLDEERPLSYVPKDPASDVSQGDSTETACRYAIATLTCAITATHSQQEHLSQREITTAFAWFFAQCHLRNISCTRGPDRSDGHTGFLYRWLFNGSFLMKLCQCLRECVLQGSNPRWCYRSSREKNDGYLLADEEKPKSRSKAAKNRNACPSVHTSNKVTAPFRYRKRIPKRDADGRKLVKWVGFGKVGKQGTA